MQQSGGNVADDGVSRSSSTDISPDPNQQFRGEVTDRNRTEGIVAELHLQHSNLALAETIETVDNVTVEPDYQIDGSATSDLLFLSVFGEDFERFEAALEGDETVADPVVVATFDDYRVYRVRLTATTLFVSSSLAEVGARVLDAASDRNGWALRTHFPGRDALAQFRTYCADNDVSFRVEKLYRPDDNDTDDGVRLTACQRKTLLEAYQTGYFDVPRGVSQQALAKQVGVCPSAVSQRLRRATAALIEETLLSSEQRNV